MHNVTLRDVTELAQTQGALKLWQCSACGAVCVTLKGIDAYICPECPLDAESRQPMEHVAWIMSVEAQKALVEVAVGG
jgi:ribosomal protein L37AE/L43A